MEYWGMTFTKGNEGRWIQVVQEALESLGFNKNAMLSNLSSSNRALVLSEYGSLLGSVYNFLANQPAPFTVPSYQHGTDYVPKTGLALLHEGEQVFPKGQSSGTTTVNLTVNPVINSYGDASPREIAKEVDNAVVHSLRYGKGRVVVQEIARSKR
jgi:hypothetical protein